MDSDDGFSDYEQDETEAWDDMEISVSTPPPFETLTTDDIVKLMNQYIEHVIAIVNVSENATSVRKWLHWMMKFLSKLIWFAF